MVNKKWAQNIFTQKKDVYTEFFKYSQSLFPAQIMLKGYQERDDAVGTPDVLPLLLYPGKRRPEMCRAFGDI